MSQKLRTTRSSVDALDNDDSKSPIENGLGDQNENKKAPSEPKDIGKSPERKDSEKQPESKLSKSPEQKGKQQSPKQEDPKESSDINGKEEITNGESEGRMITRSRSKTPQRTPVKKKKFEDKVSIKETIHEEPSRDVAGNRSNEGNSLNGSSSSPEEELNSSSDKIDMDPLVLLDIEPDLDNNENGDVSESGTASPVINRRRTRRSQARTIPVSSSPKLQDDQESDKGSQDTITDSEASTPKKVTRRRGKKQTVDTDEESLASDNLSTRAEAGSDSTRLDFTNQDSALLDENLFLAANKDRSVGETLRTLSPRRTIRQIDADYRKNLLRGSVEKNMMHFSYNKVDGVVTGLKRKYRSTSPGESKRMKLDSPGLFSWITSPLYALRNKTGSDLPTSTPKLTGYKNAADNLAPDSFENDESVSKIGLYSDEDKVNGRKWCSVM